LAALDIAKGEMVVCGEVNRGSGRIWSSEKVVHMGLIWFQLVLYDDKQVAIAGMRRTWHGLEFSSVQRELGCGHE